MVYLREDHEDRSRHKENLIHGNKPQNADLIGLQFIKEIPDELEGSWANLLKNTKIECAKIDSIIT